MKSEALHTILAELRLLLLGAGKGGLAGADERTFRNWFPAEAKEIPDFRPTTVAAVARQSWGLIDNPDGDPLRGQLLRLIRRQDPDAPSAFTAETFSTYCCRLAEGHRLRTPVLTSHSAPSPPGVDPAPSPTTPDGPLTGQPLFDRFWGPFLPAPTSVTAPPRAATIFIWDRGHHFDVLPMLELTRSFGYGADLCPYDLDGACMAPGAGDYDFTHYDAFCVLGRPSLYRCCEVLYEQATRRTRLPTFALRLPEVDRRTHAYMKKPLTDESRQHFHHVVECEGGASKRHEATDLKESQQMQLLRTDYGVIQRCTLPHAGTVIILAGCTALGTFGATIQAVKERFKKVKLPAPLSATDQLEILLKVTGSVPLQTVTEPKLRPWHVRNCEVLRVYVNGILQPPVAPAS